MNVVLLFVVLALCCCSHSSKDPDPIYEYLKMHSDHQHVDASIFIDAVCVYSDFDERYCVSDVVYYSADPSSQNNDLDGVKVIGNPDGQCTEEIKYSTALVLNKGEYVILELPGGVNVGQTIKLYVLGQYYLEDECAPQIYNVYGITADGEERHICRAYGHDTCIVELGG